MSIATDWAPTWSVKTTGFLHFAKNEDIFLILQQSIVLQIIINRVPKFMNMACYGHDCQVA